MYFTDISRWVCSCPGFVRNRFLLCKHLVRQCVNTPDGKRRRLIRSEFERRTTPPFLIINNLNTDIPDAQVVQVSETPIDNSPDNHGIDIDEDPDEEARVYVESN